MTRPDDNQGLLPSAYKALANWNWCAWPNRGSSIPSGGPTQRHIRDLSNRRGRLVLDGKYEVEP